jgi:hypothetical protein
VQVAATHQHAAGVVGHVQPFVKVECQRVGALEPGQTRLQGRAERDQRAEGAIHVEPEVLRCAEVGECREVVDRAGVDRACCPDHEEGSRALGPIPRDRATQRVELDPVVIVDLDQAERRAAEAKDLERPRDAAVRLSRGVADERRRAADAVCSYVRASEMIAGDGEPDQRRHRRAADEDAAAVFGKIEQLAAPFNHLALDVNRAVVAAAAVGVDRSGE